MKTLFLYKPFFKKAGRRNVIISPLQITCSCISMGNDVLISHHARIEGVLSYEADVFRPSIIIGDKVKIQQNLHLTAAGKIAIGNNTAIAANVTISDIIHGYENINLPPEKHPLKIKQVIIGEDCKIFNNVVVLPGTILGKHNIVGANSVVNGVFPDFVVIVGSPALIIKRFNEKTQSWEKTDSKGNFIL